VNVTPPHLTGAPAAGFLWRAAGESALLFSSAVEPMIDGNLLLSPDTTVVRRLVGWRTPACWCAFVDGKFGPDRDSSPTRDVRRLLYGPHVSY